MMEPWLDDFEAYKRYFKIGKCTCKCEKHCGFSCMTDDCECTDCECEKCLDGKGYN